MLRTIRIGLVGDYSREVTAHLAIPKALVLAGKDVGVNLNESWLATDQIAGASTKLSDFDALWCVPASPYADMNGALSAIRFARESRRPFLGTCGGFQHALIEYARNVLGCTEADHAESNPDTEMPLISPLACSLIEANGSIRLLHGSRIRSIYGQKEITEQFHCSFGFNPRFHSWLENRELHITGRDPEGDPRVIELDGHPFFIATLFQPERSALSGNSHPLIQAYVRAAASYHEGHH